MELTPTWADLKRRWVTIPCRALRRAVGCAVGWATRVGVFIGRAYSRPRYGVLLFGATVGLLVSLAGLQYHHRAQGPGALLRLPFALTMLLCWGSHVRGAFMVPNLLAFAMAAGALFSWVLAALVRGMRSRNRFVRLSPYALALLVVAAYGVTWRPSVRAVRESITQHCAKEQEWGHLEYPDEVSAVPKSPTFFYCFPVLPGIVASEHDFSYGPFMGGGSQHLWLWDGRRARWLFCYSFWSY